MINNSGIIAISCQMRQVKHLGGSTTIHKHRSYSIGYHGEQCGKFQEVQASPILLTDPERYELQALGEAQVKLVQNIETMWSKKENQPINRNCHGLYDFLSSTMWFKSLKEWEVLASPILLVESDTHEIQTLGTPQVTVLDSSDEVCVSVEHLSSQLV